MANPLTEHILDIYRKGYLMSLATTDEGGPWVADIIYVYDDGLNIYWLSNESVRHSQAIERDSRVAATITLTYAPETPEISLQIQGMAERIEGDDLERASLYEARRGKLPPKSEGEIMKPGQSWYRLRPTKIEIIDTRVWGRKKQVLALNDKENGE